VSDGRVLNICFHGIGVLEREREAGEADYWVTRDRFLRLLDEVCGWPDVVLSFDDGNTSDVEVALPALLERGRTAVFFPLAGRLGHRGSLSVEEVAELAASGMQVGTHGMSHRSWRGMDHTTATEELDEARTVIEAATGRAVEQASCPFGEYDRGALAALRRHGYLRVHTSDRRRAVPSSWIQPRFSVVRDDTPESLRAAVLGGESAARRAVRAATCAVKRWR
jgi:peptidoglycan/xylan/chitin deacetylase (PgdA/CDA1 family)